MPKPDSAPLLFAPPGTIARVEAARILGVSPGMVDQFEREGRLRAEKKNGRVYITTDSLTTLRKSYAPNLQKQNRRLGKGNKPIPGGTAAAVFACFKRGMTDVGDVVIATKASVEVVRRLWCEWKKPLECEEEP